MSDQDESTYFPSSPRDVYHAAWVLQHFLPWELVTYTINEAEYWLRLDSEFEAAPTKLIDEHKSPFICTTLPIKLFNTNRPSPVRRVTIDVWGHDQGWSTGHGTWTWYDLQLTLPCPPGQPPETHWAHLGTNAPAKKDTQHHQLVWTPEDAESEPSEGKSPEKVMRALEDGSTLSVRAHAKYPGWTNYVEGARIVAYVAVI